MSLPRWTTTVSVRRPDETGTADPWVAATQTLSTIATGVHAVFYRGHGVEKQDGTAGRSRVESFFAIDVTDVNNDDVLYDENTGVSWQVTWVQRRLPPVGTRSGSSDLDHLTGQCYVVTGEVD